MNPNMSIYRRLNPRLLVQAGLGLGLLHWANICLIYIFNNNYVFVGFYFVPNFIVIMLNLMYPVFYVDLFIRVMWERKCEDSRQLKAKVVFAGNSWVRFPRSDACALHMTGMQRVRTRWRLLVFTSVSWVRPSRKIPAKYSVLLNCHF